MSHTYQGRSQTTHPSPELSDSVSSASTSLSSSFYSSASSDILPMNSSQSDVHSSDHAAAHLPPNLKPARVHDLSVLDATRRRSPSPGSSMGNIPSKPTTSSSAASPSSSKLAFTAAVTGVRLKRAFAAKRKNKPSLDEVATSSDADDERRTHQVGRISQTPLTSRGPKLALQVAQVFAKKTGGTPISPTPPPLPPKPANMQSAKKPPHPVPPPIPLDTTNVDYHRRSSIIPMTAGISSAVNYMREEERRAAAWKPKPVDVEESKESWRKSDATTHTIRASGNVGTRTPRPVSTAESLQSTHTIMAPSKRLSTALDSDVQEENHFSQAAHEHEQLPASSWAENRRSVSLNVPTPQSDLYVTSGHHPATLNGHRSLVDPPPVVVTTRETPTLTRAAANGIFSPSTSGAQSTGNHIRGKLAAWTATTMNAPPSRTTAGPPRSPATLRQTAVSMTNGLAPAAGLARRAVEKMGRWGFSAGSSNSGYSSSSSSTAPSSYSDNALTRTSSNQSDGKHHRVRRTPDAPSGAWSVNSSLGTASLSDMDIMPPSEPFLGICLRGPLTRARGTGNGIVFHKELSIVAKTTAIDVGPHEKIGAQEPKDGAMKAFEDRELPALVVRCAQHILFWGVQEEGLFRVSGRPAHVAKIRNEFDTGADYDMIECSPGELDPHAVASVFKAFLREMPEPILTRSLGPYFDEALAKENINQPTSPSGLAKIGGRGPGLPSGPKAGINAALRKPPSLSTLAMPSFHGIPAPSILLINELKALVARLPTHNRDLLRTVTELIMATAKESRHTKMPLSNLLLVFCPSLNMNPPLLRILCETEGIWDSTPLELPVLDISHPVEKIEPRPKYQSTPAELPMRSLKYQPSLTDIGNDSGVDVDESDRESDLLSVEANDLAEVTAPQEHLPNPVAPVSPAPNHSRSPSPPGVEPASPIPSPSQDHPASLPDVDIVPARESTEESVEFVTRQDASRAVSPSTSSISSPVDDQKRKLGGPRSRPLGPRRLVSAKDPETSPSNLTSVSVDSLADSAFAPPSFNHMSNSNQSFNHSDSTNISETSFKFGQVLFPSKNGGSTPSTPLSGRRSFPIISLPGLSIKPETSSPSAPGSPFTRLKKSSIGLFSRYSNSSSSSSLGRPDISSPYTHSPRAVSDSSVAIPATPVFNYRLDTEVDSAPLELGLGLNIDLSDTHPPESPLPSATVSEFSSLREGELLPPQISRQTSTASFLSVESNEEDPDAWTKSVLAGISIGDWQASSSSNHQ